MTDPDSPPGFHVNPAAMGFNANLLNKIADELYNGRLDPEFATLATPPDAHQEVGDQVRRFTDFADDQYNDLGLLLIALSTRLRQTGSDYLHLDKQAQAEFDKILAGEHYVAPEDRQEPGRKRTTSWYPE